MASAIPDHDRLRRHSRRADGRRVAIVFSLLLLLASQAHAQALPVILSAGKWIGEQLIGYVAGKGQARLEWGVNGIAYVATIQTWGHAGVVDVAYFLAVIDSTVVVRQDLELRYHRGEWFYVGSNPRLLSNGAAFPYYSPDAFRLIPTSSGLWTITDSCDRQGCTQVATTPLM